ncbi:MAG: ABC transporter substrate-binding protein [Sulfolobaceae archaeon]|nr:ABC transporter substrate-binding protein [Sulfolobaceae archaeon]
MRNIYNPILDDFVKLPDKIESIVSLDPATTETLFMIGAGELVKATDAFSYRPKEAKALPKIGSYTHVDYKKLEEVKPDIIFTTTGAQKELTRELIRRGYNVYPVGVVNSVSAILNNVIIVGEVVNKKEESRRLYQNLLDVIEKLRCKSCEKVSVYVEFDLGGNITPGYPTHVSDALDLLGFKNIFDDRDEAYFIAEAEEILKRDPKVIIFEPKRYREGEEERFKDSLRSRGLGSLANRNIFLTRGDFLAHMGPSFITESMKWIKEVRDKL